MSLLNRISSQIATVEGKKHQASIGDIKEIMKIIGLLYYHNPYFREDLDDYLDEVHDKEIKKANKQSKIVLKKFQEAIKKSKKLNEKTKTVRTK